MTESKLWVLKTVSDEDKSSTTIESYDDRLSEYYNYDSLVGNSKQITINDLAILIDKKKILGFALIGNIDIDTGDKTIRTCPKCPSTTIDKRKHKKPTYRCNNGHEFESPIEKVKQVTKYSAKFKRFLSIETYKDDLSQLRNYYTNGYNQNMSMQRLDIKALSLFNGLGSKLMNENSKYSELNLLQGLTKENIEKYHLNNIDEREVSLRAIKQRRGQQFFRNSLLIKYNSTCVISGCKIVAILEAAHINPYRGLKDNHSDNGLLLRADLHTLFDLDMIRINPNDLTVEISENLIGSEYEQYNNLSLKRFQNHISKDALKIKFEEN